MKDWQAEWAKEYKRTTGRDATMEHIGGGWYKPYGNGSAPFFSGKRKEHWLKAIERLKQRPDFESS